jgi:hypothetical protein
MSKKHFEALARALAKIRPANGEKITWEEVIRAVANVCIEFNPRFNMDRFLDACLEKKQEKKGEKK